MRVDAVIFGAGIAGCTTAIVLARAGYDVLLLDNAPALASSPGEALAPAARLVLKAIGIWESFAATSPLECVGSAAAWHGSEPQLKSFVFDPNGSGWHIDRMRFGQMLESAATNAGVRICRSIGNVSVVRSDGWRVGWSQKNGPAKSVGAKFAVDATGHRRFLSRRLGVRALHYDRMIGWIGYVHQRHVAEAVTLVEPVADGWWYSAPVPNDTVAVAYMSDADLTRRNKLVDLAKDCGDRLSCFARFGAEHRDWIPKGFSAASSQLEQSAGQDWLAVGDAAAAHDPLSAQGMFMALHGAVRAAEAISHALHGRPNFLKQFAEMCSASFDRYLRDRQILYGMQPRWPDRRFWMRRRAHPTALYRV